MNDFPPRAEASLLVSSAPLGWPDITVEVRFTKAGSAIGWPAIATRHSVLFWDQPIGGAIIIGGAELETIHLAAPIILVPAGQSFTCNPGIPQRFRKLLIDAAFVSRLAESALGVNPVSFQAAAFDGDQDLRGVAYLLSEAVTGHQPLDAEMIAVLARETAIHLASNYSDVPTPRRDLAGRIATAKLVRVLDFLAANLDRRLSVAILAREAGLSIAHFSRAFAKSTGRSPHAYIVGRRIAKAGHLLRNSSIPIDKIAALCGFHDQAHLNRLFKRTTGHTPKQYRSRTG